MSVQFLSCELNKWEELPGDTLVLTFFREERPLRGAAGLADWRLCGRLSRLIKMGRVGGEGGETLIMPPGRRLPFERIMLFGLGPSAGFDEAAFRRSVKRIREVMKRAKVDDYALQPPGRATGLVAARRALEMWIEESGDADENERVSIIDTPGAQKEMADILHARQRLKMKALEEAQAQAAAAAKAKAKAEAEAQLSGPDPGSGSGSSSGSAPGSAAPP
ncbi:MAG TPA: M17 family peptidase N-terminal domain-containing protein [Kofleriaceae bacterium]|nr:M17 family peptidase N-terminal domain-containing protein [Kofleriaceae bacterium]